MSDDDEREAPSGEVEDDGIEHWYQGLRRVRVRRPMAYAMAQVLITASLAGLAVGVHWWLNVPEKIVESSHDQGSKKKKKKKKARRSRGRNKSARNDRSPEELEEHWRRYSPEPFEDEPTRPVWARRHQALINRAVVVARREAFEGAPEQPRVVLGSTKCRTVRCRFTLRSQYPHALESVGEALSRLQSEEQDVWRTFDLAPVPAPEDEDGKEDEHYVEVIVSFHNDKTDSRDLTIRPIPMVEATPEATPEADEPSGA